jgi:hypothetical protein
MWIVAMKLVSGFFGARSDAFELLELEEEVLDQMMSFVRLCVDRATVGIRPGTPCDLHV